MFSTSLQCSSIYSSVYKLWRNYILKTNAPILIQIGTLGEGVKRSNFGDQEVKGQGRVSKVKVVWGQR